MKIDGNSPIRNSPLRRKEAKRTEGDDGGFAGRLTTEAGARPAGVTSNGTVAVDPLLVVQEAADATQEKGRAKARGEALLDRLDELRMGLLMGFYPKERIEDLVRMVRAQRPNVPEGPLAEVLDEIELRAAVELAKLGVEA